MSYTLINDMNYRIKKLDESVGMLAKAGREKAETEAKARIAIQQETLRLRAEGKPVTIIRDLTRGSASKEILERDIAESTYQAIIESINAQKIAIRVLDAQISREWTSKKGGI